MPGVKGETTSFVAHRVGGTSSGGVAPERARTMRDTPRSVSRPSDAQTNGKTLKCAAAGANRANYAQLGGLAIE